MENVQKEAILSLFKKYVHF